MLKTEVLVAGLLVAEGAGDGNCVDGSVGDMSVGDGNVRDRGVGDRRSW